MNLKEIRKGYMGLERGKRKMKCNWITIPKINEKNLSLLLTNQENRKSKIKAQMEVVCEEALAPDSEKVHSHYTLTREKDGLTAWVALVLEAIPFIEALITSSQYHQAPGLKYQHMNLRGI